MNTNTKKFFILGAADPEMAAIEFVLNKMHYLKGIDYTYAQDSSGRRVAQGTAHRAKTTEHDIPENRQLFTIECSISYVSQSTSPVFLYKIDHHALGDNGFGQPPENYWTASSIGQVCTLLDYPDCDSLRLCAASDHCLLDAYAGKCPGVDPDKLMTYRAKSRSRAQNKAVSLVIQDINKARTILKAAPKIDLEGTAVADMRAFQFIPELPEAAARENIPYLSIQRDKKTNQRKLVLWSAPPSAVNAFLQANKYSETYGDVLRGFAGVYLED